MAGAILFLDIAPNWTGYCVGDGKSAPVADAWQFPATGDDYGALACHLEDWVRTLVERHEVEICGYESPILRRHDTLHTLRRILSLGVMFEAVCQRIGEERGRPLPCKEVDLRIIKNFTTGNQWAEKKDVAAAVTAAGIPLPAAVAQGRHDAADASGGWAVLLSEYDGEAASPWVARFRGGLL